MTTSNQQLALGVFQLVSAFSSSNNLPLAYPGKKFSPPDSGQWLELTIAPNDIEDTLNGKESSKRGMFQINVAGRPDKNPMNLFDVSDLLSTEFEKGTILHGITRVTRTPYTMSIISLDDRVLLPVTIEYSE